MGPALMLLFCSVCCALLSVQHQRRSASHSASGLLHAAASFVRRSRGWFAWILHVLQATAASRRFQHEEMMAQHATSALSQFDS